MAPWLDIISEQILHKLHMRWGVNWFAKPGPAMLDSICFHFETTKGQTAIVEMSQERYVNLCLSAVSFNSNNKEFQPTADNIHTWIINEYSILHKIRKANQKKSSFTEGYKTYDTDDIFGETGSEEQWQNAFKQRRAGSQAQQDPYDDMFGSKGFKGKHFEDANFEDFFTKFWQGHGGNPFGQQGSSGNANRDRKNAKPFTTGGSTESKYHTVLGVKHGATQAEIKTAYRKLVMIWHPDKNPTNLKAAEEKMKIINEAYNILKR